eukprot:scaffold8224_cov118-Isochrysis_galbana.AAC.2
MVHAARPPWQRTVPTPVRPPPPAAPGRPPGSPPAAATPAARAPPAGVARCGGSTSGASRSIASDARSPEPAAMGHVAEAALAARASLSSSASAAAAAVCAMAVAWRATPLASPGESASDAAMAAAMAASSESWLAGDETSGGVAIGGVDSITVSSLKEGRLASWVLEFSWVSAGASGGSVRERLAGCAEPSEPETSRGSPASPPSAMGSSSTTSCESSNSSSKMMSDRMSTPSAPEMSTASTEIAPCRRRAARGLTLPAGGVGARLSAMARRIISSSSARLAGLLSRPPPLAETWSLHPPRERPTG